MPVSSEASTSKSHDETVGCAVVPHSQQQQQPAPPVTASSSSSYCMLDGATRDGSAPLFLPLNPATAITPTRSLSSSSIDVSVGRSEGQLPQLRQVPLATPAGHSDPLTRPLWRSVPQQRTTVSLVGPISIHPQFNPSPVSSSTAWQGAPPATSAAAAAALSSSSSSLVAATAEAPPRVALPSTELHRSGVGGGQSGSVSATSVTPPSTPTLVQRRRPTSGMGALSWTTHLTSPSGRRLQDGEEHGLSLAAPPPTTTTNLSSAVSPSPCRAFVPYASEFILPGRSRSCRSSSLSLGSRRTPCLSSGERGDLDGFDGCDVTRPGARHFHTSPVSPSSQQESQSIFRSGLMLSLHEDDDVGAMEAPMTPQSYSTMMQTRDSGESAYQSYMGSRLTSHCETLSLRHSLPQMSISSAQQEESLFESGAAGLPEPTEADAPCSVGDWSHAAESPEVDDPAMIVSPTGVATQSVTPFGSFYLLGHSAELLDGSLTPLSIPPLPRDLTQLRHGARRRHNQRLLDDNGVLETPQVEERVAVSADGRESYCILNEKYAIYDHELGKGSYSVVKLCYSLKDGGFYAAKVLDCVRLRRQQLGGEMGQLKIEREIGIMKQLRHNNIVALHEVVGEVHGKRVYLILELAACGEVLSMQDNGDVVPFADGSAEYSEDEARRMVRGVLNALMYAHYLGIAHRDVKPSNMLLTASGEVKLCDFGASVLVGESTMQVHREGSVAFLAPEMLASSEVEVSRFVTPITSLPVTIVEEPTGGGSSLATQFSSESLSAGISGAVNSFATSLSSGAQATPGVPSQCTDAACRCSLEWDCVPDEASFLPLSLSQRRVSLRRLTASSRSEGASLPPAVSRYIAWLAMSRIDGVDLFKTDVFSLGVTAYTLLVGCLPWRACDPMTQLVAILTQPDPFLHLYREAYDDSYATPGTGELPWELPVEERETAGLPLGSLPVPEVAEKEEGEMSTRQDPPDTVATDIPLHIMTSLPAVHRATSKSSIQDLRSLTSKGGCTSDGDSITNTTAEATLLGLLQSGVKSGVATPMGLAMSHWGNIKLSTLIRLATPSSGLATHIDPMVGVGELSFSTSLLGVMGHELRSTPPTPPEHHTTTTTQQEWSPTASLPLPVVPQPEVQPWRSLGDASTAQKESQSDLAGSCEELPADSSLTPKMAISVHAARSASPASCRVSINAESDGCDDEPLCTPGSFQIPESESQVLAGPIDAGEAVTPVLRGTVMEHYHSISPLSSASAPSTSSESSASDSDGDDRIYEELFDNQPCRSYSMMESLPLPLQRRNRGDLLSAAAVDFVRCCLTLDPDRRLTVYELYHHPWIRGDELNAHADCYKSRNISVGSKAVDQTDVEEGEQQHTIAENKEASSITFTAMAESADPFPYASRRPFDMGSHNEVDTAPSREAELLPGLSTVLLLPRIDSNATSCWRTDSNLTAVPSPEGSSSNGPGAFVSAMVDVPPTSDALLLSSTTSHATTVSSEERKGDYAMAQAGLLYKEPSALTSHSLDTSATATPRTGVTHYAAMYRYPAGHAVEDQMSPIDDLPDHTDRLIASGHTLSSTFSTLDATGMMTSSMAADGEGSGSGPGGSDLTSARGAVVPLLRSGTAVNRPVGGWTSDAALLLLSPRSISTSEGPDDLFLCSPTTAEETPRGRVEAPRSCPPPPRSVVVPFSYPSAVAVTGERVPALAGPNDGALSSPLRRFLRRRANGDAEDSPQ